jgi:ATP-dependent DNA ligase
LIEPVKFHIEKEQTMTILEILNQIDATRSKKEKVAIMTQHKDNADLKDFFRLCLHPRINFFQKKDMGIVSEEVVPTYSLSKAMGYLEKTIAARVVTGNDAIEGIRDVLAQVSADDAEVIRRILKKKTGCGVDSSANDVWPKLIPEHPNLLASPYSQKLADALDWKRGVIVERKSDGLRISIHVQEDSVTIYSRAGNILDLHGRFDALLNAPECVGRVFDAELMVLKPDGKYESRKTGNGICSKAIKGTLSKEESLRMVAVSWDVIHEEVFFGGEKCMLDAAERFSQLLRFVSDENVKPLIRPIEHDVVYSLEEAQAIYQKYRDAGEEGAMLKDSSVMWEDRRSKKILKMKAEETCELKVTGYNDGQGEFANYVGSLILSSRDNKVVVSMSGFPLKLRAEITANIHHKVVTYDVAAGVDSEGKPLWMTYEAYPNDTEINLGSIVEVTYNEKIKSRDSEVYSLFLPRFDKVRHDKLEANSFEEIK